MSVVFFYKISTFVLAFSRYILAGALRCLGGINRFDENFTREIAREIEKFWEPRLSEKKFDENKSEEKLYILSMFPYPSGQLHLGHIKVYGTSDFLARYFRMKGKNVFHPMGWDAFGLPAENAALERGVHPNEWTQKNIANMKSVMEKFNFSFDWDRELATCDSEYYKWTQFFFVKLFKMGLVYRKEAFVNWDPVDKTVVADEQVNSDGRSWRSGALVEKKPLKQWFVKTTAFAKSLYDGLQDPLLQGWGEARDIQKNWIGEVNGTTIDFDIVNGISENGNKKIPIWMKNPEYIDKAKFVAVRPKSYWGLGSDTNGFMHYQLKNPFTGEVLPVYKTDKITFARGSEVHLGIPELNEEDKQFADSVKIEYRIEGLQLAREEELLQLREQICAEARERGIGGYPRSSNLKDWLISRQRYWGTPIPIVHCKKCGEQPVPEEDLPVRLPEANDPLGTQLDWLSTTCPKCGGEAARETDTMDTFVDSSWYYLRFLDPDNEDAAFDVKKIKKLTPVDIYVGGLEHAALHLFYARFMNHFLHSLSLVPHREPFARFLSQGIVRALTYKSKTTGKYVKSELVKTKDEHFLHAETEEVLTKEWEKMSKSKCNSVDPLSIADEFGVDMLRLVILRASSPRCELNWSDSHFDETFYWQRKLWKTVSDFIKIRSLNTSKPVETEEYKALDFFIYDSRNFILNLVTKLIENSFDVGNALRKLQHLTGCCRKCTKDVVAHSLHFERTLALQIILLAPCTPYFASELWTGFTKAPNRLCDSGEILWDRSVFEQPWPKVDSDYKKISLGSKNSEQSAMLSKFVKTELKYKRVGKRKYVKVQPEEKRQKMDKEQ